MNQFDINIYLVGQDVTTLVGSAGIDIRQDGNFFTARLHIPATILLSGNLIYFTEAGKSQVDGALRVIDLNAGTVETLVSFQTSNLMNRPLGVSFECNPDAILIGDTNLDRVLRYSVSTRNLVTFAGSGEEGSTDGPLLTGSMDDPFGFYLHNNGTLYIADTDRGIRVIRDLCSPNGPVGDPIPLVPIIAGSIVGVVALVILVIVAICLVRKRREPRRKRSEATAILFDVQIGKVIGEGFFSKVYVGTMGGNTVACKLLKNEQQISSLKDEAATMKSLSHPTIVHYFGVYQKESQTYMVTEYCDLGCLENLMKEPPPVDELITL